MSMASIYIQFLIIIVVCLATLCHLQYVGLCIILYTSPYSSFYNLPNDTLVFILRQVFMDIWVTYIDNLLRTYSTPKENSAGISGHPHDAKFLFLHLKLTELVFVPVDSDR